MRSKFTNTCQQMWLLSCLNKDTVGLSSGVSFLASFSENILSNQQNPNLGAISISILAYTGI